MNWMRPNMRKFINDFEAPNGYDTVWGKGVNLSGLTKAANFHCAGAGFDSYPSFRWPFQRLICKRRRSCLKQSAHTIAQLWSLHKKWPRRWKPDQILLLGDGRLIEKGHSQWAAFWISIAKAHFTSHNSGREGASHAKDSQAFPASQTANWQKEDCEKRAKAWIQGHTETNLVLLGWKKGLLILVMLIVCHQRHIRAPWPLWSEGHWPFYRQGKLVSGDSPFCFFCSLSHIISVPVALVSKLLDDYDLAEHGFQNEAGISPICMSCRFHFFDKQRHGRLMSRVTNDIENVSSTLNTSVIQILSSVITFVGTIAVMLYSRPLAHWLRWPLFRWVAASPEMDHQPNLGKAV